MECFRPVTGKTAICGIIGDPVEHTMSPAMQNAAFQKLGLDFIYVPFRVRKEALDEAIAGMRALNLRGLNVTIPHKEAIIPFLDKLDPAAEKIGAVNTIVNHNGELTGYNTDADGFLRALLEHGFTPDGKNAVILGAGGAARAISYALAQRGTRLTMVNRSLARAQNLAHWLNQTLRTVAKVLPRDEANLATALSQADLIINATSVGMSPQHRETPLPGKLLQPGLVVFDSVYNPLQTRLLQEAESAGAQTISGIDMLVGQGALAFTLWTGQPAPIDLMREEAIKALGHEK